jgi:predicted MFS family arabinose efflux permease
MYVVALPYLALDFGADSMELGLLSALRGGAYVLATLPAALLVDRVSRRGLILMSTGAVALVYVATAGAGSLWHLWVGTAIWAVGLSPYWPSLFSWLGDSHAGEHLGAATGVVNLSWSSGNILGGLLGGWLFGLYRPSPFVVAVIPVAAACAALVLSPAVDQRAAPEAGRERARGTRRGLAAVWLGNVSVCAVLGLTLGVFPKLGETLGIHAGLFGVLVAGLGLGRTLMFLVGFRYSAAARSAWLGLGAQLVAGGAVASIVFAHSFWHLMAVFVSAGSALGLNYYRGLYKSLEHAGSRGLKSGLHEATLLSGVLFGSLGGGAMAKHWGLRAPYVPLALGIVCLVAVQAVLLASVRAGGSPKSGMVAE